MMTYILIGVVFMFGIEYLLSLKSIKDKLTIEYDLGLIERIMGIFFWPIYLIIFLYSFCKEYFK